LHVRNPDRLNQFIAKLNAAQIKADKVKLTAHEYKGITYHCRTEGTKTQFYVVKDSVAAIASREDVLRSFLDRRAAPAKDTPWRSRFERAGMKALLTLCVNPRMLDADILQNNKKEDPLPGYWRALEAIFVTVSIQESVELRLTLQAKAEQLPDWARGAFTHTAPASALWQRFPEQSILTIASQTDFSGAGDALKLLMPEKDRKKLVGDWQTGIGAVLRLDPFKDILPNIGPDWGVCVLPAKDEKQLPQVLFALAVKPGEKNTPVDQTLYKAVELVAGIAVLDYNKNHPGSAIRLQTMMQDKVEVKYLANDNLFPAGFQPACALKEGYLLFASSPNAIANFRLHDKKLVDQTDTPLLSVSAAGLAKLFEQRRDHILSSLSDRQQMSAQAAQKSLDDVTGLLGLFDRLTLSTHGNGGQASWSIRLTPARQ
jgi:hypothetical protein